MRLPPSLRWSLPALSLLALPGFLLAEVVAVNSQVFNGYVRHQLPNGTFQPETYTFAEGGCWSHALHDPGMEKLKFMDIVRVLAGPLVKVNYRPGLKASDTQLLIMVYWGSTQGSNELDRNNLRNGASAAIAAYDRTDDIDGTPKSAMDRSLDRKAVDSRTPEGAAYESFLWQLGVSNRMRDELDDMNARILGYAEALDRARFAVQLSSSQDVLQELGANRYYVVLQAYDFKVAQRDKKLRPLWTTRLSVSEDGPFATALDRMAWNGARHFGRTTDGLKREAKATVELAPLEILESTPVVK